MSDDLRDDVAALRRLRGAVLAERGPPLYAVDAMALATRDYVHAAINLAPRLADAWERAMATVAERDAEIARLKADSRKIDGVTARYQCPKCNAPFGVSFDRRSNAFLCRGMVPEIDAATNFPKWVPCTFSCKDADALKGANRDE